MAPQKKSAKKSVKKQVKKERFSYARALKKAHAELNEALDAIREKDEQRASKDRLITSLTHDLGRVSDQLTDANSQLERNVIEKSRFERTISSMEREITIARTTLTEASILGTELERDVVECQFDTLFVLRQLRRTTEALQEKKE